MMLHRTIFNIVRRTTCTNARIFCALENTSKFSPRLSNISVNSHLHQTLNFVIFKRFKTKGRTSKRSEDEEDDDLDVDDYLNTDKSKVIKTTIPSFRLDAVAKAGFGVSRAKLDKEFYKSNLRINGQKCLKKSITVKVGDEIDLVQSRCPDNSDYLIVNRCILLEVDADPEAGTIYATFVQNKSLLIEDYKDKWHSDK